MQHPIEGPPSILLVSSKASSSKEEWEDQSSPSPLLSAGAHGILVDFTEMQLHSLSGTFGCSLQHTHTEFHAYNGLHKTALEHEAQAATEKRAPGLQSMGKAKSQGPPHRQEASRCIWSPPDENHRPGEPQKEKLLREVPLGTVASYGRLPLGRTCLPVTAHSVSTWQLEGVLGEP